MVHVGHGHAPAAPGPQAHEGEAFEQLAANGTGAHLPAEGLSQRPGRRPPRPLTPLTRR